MRLGADTPPSGYERFVGVGFDANLDGVLDLFLAVDNTGSPDRLASNTPLFAYALSASNFHYGGVDATIDPPATSFDLDTDGKTDYFVSFVIPFADVVSAVSAQGISGLNDTVAMRFVVGSSTQPNALNQDLGGPTGSISSNQTWGQLGAISNPLTAAGGFPPVPEPGTASLLSLGLFALPVRSRGRRVPSSLDA